MIWTLAGILRRNLILIVTWIVRRIVGRRQAMGLVVLAGHDWVEGSAKVGSVSDRTGRRLPVQIVEGSYEVYILAI